MNFAGKMLTPKCQTLLVVKIVVQNRGNFILPVDVSGLIQKQQISEIKDLDTQNGLKKGGMVETGFYEEKRLSPEWTPQA